MSRSEDDEKPHSVDRYRDFEQPWNLLFIDLERLVDNWRTLSDLVGEGRALYSVVKADAYGHGIEQVGSALSGAGCRHFAVESPQEGMQLRRLGIDGEILLLNPIPPWMAELSVYYDLSVSVIHPSILEPLREACRTTAKRCRVHLNANVGLHRLGIAPSKLLDVALQTVATPELELEGLMAQPRDSEMAMKGFERLHELARMLAAHGVVPRKLHYANSTTFMTHPQTMADGARLGILLYGVLPPERYGERRASISVEPVMRLETRIVQVRELSEGSRIGYRARQVTARDSVIGTLPLGYSHGLDRSLSRGGYVLVRGRRAPFIGAISMNSSTVDLTDVPGAAVDDQVIVVGSQDGEHIYLNDMARHSGTIAAELMVRFGQGVARRYVSPADKRDRWPFEPARGDEASWEIRYVTTEQDLPDGIGLQDVIRFLSRHLSPYDDPEAIIRRALDFSLGSYVGGRGFVLLALRDGELAGVLTCARTTTGGFLPDNIIGYVAVHREHRAMGIGSELVRRALSLVEGDAKLHVRHDNPARRFYERLGFDGKMVEMRYINGGRTLTWTR